MKRKLIRLLATAALTLTATASMAATAVADAYVEVGNPGQFELSGIMEAAPQGGGYFHGCDMEITVDVYSDGSALLQAEAHNGVYGMNRNCQGGGEDMLDPYEGWQWPGQIVGPGDEEDNPGYTGTGDFELVVWSNTVFSENYGFGTVLHRFSIDDEGTNESWAFHDQALDPTASYPRNQIVYKTWGSFEDDVTQLDIETIVE